MLRVLHTESSGRPFAINVNGPAQLAWQPRTLPEAIATARNLQRLGLNFDAGPWQINSANWRWTGLDAQTVFDPCHNARAAQAVLLDCFDRAPGINDQQRLRAALSCFNTGGFTAGFRNGYVGRVLRAPVAVPSPAALMESPL